MVMISNESPIDLLSEDVLHLARELIGYELHTFIHGRHCSGIISETEAYAGVHDRASHAWGGRRTERTKVMYKKGGIAYVYFTYGMHYLFNIVTGPEEVPHAILIRAIWPQIGLEIMQQRRKNKPFQLLANGPAKLCQAMGIDLQQNGVEIGSSIIWLGRKHVIEPANIIAGPRVGVDYAGEDALLPYRFVWVNPSL